MSSLWHCCVALLLLVICFTPAAGQSNDWATYGYDAGRSSYNRNELVLDPQSVVGLQPQWSVDLGAAITAQPITVHDAVIAGLPTALVYIGAANGVFAAFDAATGAAVWRRQLLTETNGCTQQPGGIFGVVGTPVHDPATHRIYVADGAGLLYALDDATGQTAPGWPIQVLPHPDHEFVWGALSLANGRILVENASYCDIAPYTGFVLSVDPVAAQVAATFAVTKIGDGGGIWGYGGAAVDPVNQAIYVATGNGLSSETSGFSEDVIRLDPSLAVVGANYAGLTGGDVDYGATPFLYSTPCNNQTAAINKSGVLVTYDRDNIDAGPLQKLQISDSSGDLIGDLAQDSTTGLIFVATPNNAPSGIYHHGLLAFDVNASCRLELAWQAGIGTSGSGPLSSPTAIPGVVFVTSGGGSTLDALNARTGAVLWTSGKAIGGPVYVAPAVIGGQVFLGSWDHHLYAFGLPASPLFAALLPGARSVALGTAATVFATLLNSGGTSLNNCQIALPASAPGGLALTYQTTDPATNQLTGLPNQPVTIAAHAGQSFVLGFTAPAALSDPAQGLVLACDGITHAASIRGLNTIDLTISATPVADIVALAATASGNGILQIPLSSGGAAAFAAASINVGVGGTLTASTDFGGAALPVTATLCQTNPVNGQCLTPPAASVAVTIGAAATPTFSVFATASSAIPFAPGASRIFLRFTDAAGVSHGSTSVAVRTD
jgi:outer membrane protein assembly factor BamB